MSVLHRADITYAAGCFIVVLFFPLWVGHRLKPALSLVLQAHCPMCVFKSLKPYTRLGRQLSYMVLVLTQKVGTIISFLNGFLPFPVKKKTSFFCLFVCFETGSSYAALSGLELHDIDQAGLEHRDPSASAS